MALTKLAAKQMRRSFEMAIYLDYFLTGGTKGWLETIIFASGVMAGYSSIILCLPHRRPGHYRARAVIVLFTFDGLARTSVPVRPT